MQNKKLLFLLIGLSICLLFNAQTPFPPFPQRPGFNVLNPKADGNWEFVKQRLFDGSTSKVLKYNSDIRIKLYGNPTKEDSTIISGLIKELKIIITSIDVRYIREHGNLVITFNNGPEAKDYGGKSFIGIGNNYDIIRSSMKNKKHPESFYQFFARYDTLVNDYSSITLSFNDSISISDRKRYIEYMVVQSLCKVNEKSYKFRIVSNKGAILGKAYWDDDPFDTEFDAKDKFLLSKLYSADFQKQFKEYIIKSYSWQYYMNFVNKGLMRSLGISCTIIMSLIILLLSYKPVFRHNFRRKYFNYLFPALVITTTVYLIQYVYLSITSSPPYLVGGLFNVAFLAPLAAVITSSLYFLIEKIFLWPKMPNQVQSVLKVTLLFLFVMFPAYYLFSGEIRSSGKFLIFCALAVVLSVGRGIFLFIKYSEELLVRAKDSEISRLKELKAKAEVQSLHSKINPHFLYNSLNSIAGLAHSNPDKTEKMALSLSDLFRYSINRKDEQMSSIREEVEIVRSYLEIEQIRFGDRLSFKIEIDKNLEILQIPRFIIQPLVENAIKHGISNIEGKGEIAISVQKNEDAIVITVGDNGPAFPDGLVSGYGLQSLYDLLNLTYGDKAGVNWQNKPDKFIRVTIPIES